MELIVFLVLFIFSGVQSNEIYDNVSRSGENVINEDQIISRALGRDTNKLLFQNELEQLFDAFGRNNSEEVDEISNTLEQVILPNFEKPSTLEDMKIHSVVKIYIESYFY